MVWSHEHAKALKDVFEALDRNHIKWMIMRNYEGLPEINTSKDIDIAIPRRDWKKARGVIYTVLKERGFEKVLFTKFQSILCHTFYKFQNDNIIALKIDIFACYEWRGAEYISFDKLYDNSIVYNGMHVPDKVMDAVMLFLKPLLLGGVIKGKYQKIYEKVIPENVDETKQILGEIVGAKEAEYLVGLIMHKENDTLKKRYKIVRIKLWKKYFWQHPFSTLIRMNQHYWIELRRRVFSFSNNVFAVLGPDGVGKSTFLEMWKSLLIEYVPMEESMITIIHFRPNILPNIKKLILGKKFDVNREDFNSPHRAEPVGFFSSLVRLGYYWLDYIIGVPIKQTEARFYGKYIIFDRYFYDFLVDPYRTRIKLPYMVRKFFLTLVYKPRITYVLVTDAQIVFNRKQELDLPEIERQVACYEKLVNNKNIVRLDATKKQEEIAKDAFKTFVLRLGENL